MSLRRRLCLLVTLFLFSYHLAAYAEEQPKEGNEGVAAFLKQLFEVRAELLLTETGNKLEPFYVMGERGSHYAFQHELRRSRYIKEWAKNRGVVITDAVTNLRIVRTSVNENGAKVSVIQSLKLDYMYPGTNLPPQSFGIGTRHGMTLRKVNDKWHVLREWYSDPLDEDHEMIPVFTSEEPIQEDAPKQTTTMKAKKSWRKSFNRKKAVAYADKYAGAAWMAGNNNRYNPKYRDYTYLGGDCTNFASQVIGDSDEGGGLPMRSGWFYLYKAGGSETWVRTDSFKHFLVRSGYGKVVMRGTFAQVTKPSKQYPKGAIAELQPGDLIGYEWHGGIDHFSIVTARDDNGYLLVNSHTADRYHVPWDLGWDKTTKFHLIHIRD